MLVAAVLCGLLCAAAADATTKTTTSPASKASSTHKKKKSKGKKTSRTRGQKAIDSERAQQIQEALIREHYMKGQPSGKWDEATQAALRRFQADNGWQNKTVPDSRALIKLGLGPNHDHLLNPETAMTTAGGTDPKPAAKPASTDPPSQTSTNPAASPQQ
jgi:peptidoglycan hydrolase-like protein with peptidoglycan-binding domain